MALGNFAVTISGESRMWRRTFDNMKNVETLTGKSLAVLARSGAVLTVNELYNILRTVLNKDDVPDKDLKQFIADDFRGSLNAVADILIKLLGVDDVAAPVPSD